MIHVLCDICNITCRSQRNYIVHMKEHHPEVIFPCSICGKQYRMWSGRFKHEKTHSGKHYVCMICGRAFKTLDGLNHHTPVHNPESKRYCETCGKGFATKSNLKRHEKIHLNLSIPCPNCDKTFNTEEKVQRHRRGSHGPGYTTRCGQFTYAWPGKRHRHQKNCPQCIDLLKQQEAKMFPEFRHS